MMFASRLWAVIEDMAQMTAAAAAMDLGPNLEDEFAIFFCPNSIRQTFKEAGPASAAIVLRV